MPFSGEEGKRVYWKLEGRDDVPALVLLNSIGTDMDLWDGALPLLRQSHRLLRVDTRGHGASDVADEDYAMAGLAADIFGAMDGAGITVAAVAGVSLGGMIAMEMALARPDRVAALSLVCTSAKMDKTAWSDRVAKVRGEGMAAIVDLAMGRFLSPEFIAAEPAVAQTIRRQLVNMAASGYAGCAAAIRDMDLASRIGQIGCPTLVVTGDRDTSTPFEGHGEYLLAQIPGANHAALPAAHLAPLEAPRLLAETMLEFLKD
ncbi:MULTISPECIES: 3-oxoadipate enol-lactonase [Sphingomonadales]|jgi:3-oxoadipate enol-lactonase|uniref:3-oxoadipate enol-lactonase 2 n=1 Tax=Edaphosphingomonas haloaromaticamans TaxID=653954 RepID=A0A1S1H7H8_9SPHN|nr:MULTISPECIES: 3-oxoadipate enol-lactonase [Sphingomonadaceae]OHT17752.1 3-oxoadipate enol-lactonase 2 [Sphingomonas haloaromaticamans]